MASTTTEPTPRHDDQSNLEALQLTTNIIVEELKQLYVENMHVRRMSKNSWLEVKELLDQKKQSLGYQIQILDKELADLHAKITDVEQKMKLRRMKIIQVYEAVLTSVYTERMPSKVPHVHQIVMKFEGKEHELLPLLRKSYGVAADTTILDDNKINYTTGIDPVIHALEQERSEFWKQIADIEHMRMRTEDETEALKREVYFPRVDGWRFKYGIDGVYFATRNIWVEYVKLQAVINIVQGIRTPRILVQVGNNVAEDEPRTPSLSVASETDAPPKDGSCGSCSLRFNRFSLYGEKGTKVPSIQIEQLDLKVDFTLTLPLEFDKIKNAWRTANSFKFRIVNLKSAIKGSISLPKSILRMVLNHILPGVIKRELLAVIPVDLGHYLMQTVDCPRKEISTRPMRIDLDIDLVGNPKTVTSLDYNFQNFWSRSKTAPDIEHMDVVNLLQMTHMEAVAFVKGQEFIHRIYTDKCQFQYNLAKEWPGPITCVSDLVDYVEKYSSVYFHPMSGHNADPSTETWNKLETAWASFYTRFCQIYRLPQVDVCRLFANARKLSAKPISIEVHLSNATLYTSVDMLLDLIRNIQIRNAEDLHKNFKATKKRITKPLDMMVADIEQWYSDAQVPVGYIKDLLYNLSTTVRGSCSGGQFSVKLEDFRLEGPVEVEIPFIQESYEPAAFTVDTRVGENEKSFNIAFRINDTTYLEIYLCDLKSGVFFDAKGYLCQHMLEFMNKQLAMSSGREDATSKQLRKYLTPGGGKTKHTSTSSVATGGTDVTNDTQDTHIEHDEEVDGDTSAAHLTSNSKSLDELESASNDAGPSLHSFMQAFLADTTESEDGYISMMGIHFDFKDSQSYSLAGDSHGSAVIRTSASTVGTRGSVPTLIDFINILIDSQVDTKETSEEKKTRQRMSHIFKKYLMSQNFSLSFQFLAQGAVRHGDLVGSLVQNYDDIRSVLKFSHEFSLMELISDIEDLTK